MKKILIFGCGAMGGAILSGCLAKGLWKKEEIYVKEHSEEASREKASRYGVHASMDGREAKEADLVILAVKPNVVPGVLQEISRYHPSRVLSIAAAVTLEALEGALPEETEVIRVMPNTPASVGEGMAAIAPGKKASPDFIREAEEIFSALGKEAVVTERQLDELGALYGAAKMVLETGKHPAELRDQVTSPGGTTIAGIHAMERDGIRAALMDGVKACLEKSDAMAGK